VFNPCKTLIWRLTLLPKIPVGFVNYAHVTTERTTPVGDFIHRYRGIILFLIRSIISRDSARGTIVTNWPKRVVYAGQNTREPIIGVTDITTVPGERGTLINRLQESKCQKASLG
jgi:hypothetical protein